MPNENDTANPWVMKSLGDSQRHRQELDERVEATIGLTKEQCQEHGQNLMKQFKQRLREQGRMIGEKMVKEY